MLPDEHEASTIGPPPLTLPWTWRLSIVPVTVMVTGCTESMVPELVREIKRARSETGMGLNELLKGLREQRERYHKEKYASK